MSLSKRIVLLSGINDYYIGMVDMSINGNSQFIYFDSDEFKRICIMLGIHLTYVEELSTFVKSNEIANNASINSINDYTITSIINSDNKRYYAININDYLLFIFNNTVYISQVSINFADIYVDLNANYFPNFNLCVVNNNEFSKLVKIIELSNEIAICDKETAFVITSLNNKFKAIHLHKYDYINSVDISELVYNAIL